MFTFAEPHFKNHLQPQRDECRVIITENPLGTNNSNLKEDLIEVKKNLRFDNRHL